MFLEGFRKSIAASWRIEQKREKDLKIVLSITTLTFFLLHLPRSDIIDIIGDVATNDSMTQGCDWPV